VQILFLNKVDVLQNKLKDPAQQVAINFPDYTGQPGSSTDAIDFFKRKFFTLNRNPEKQIYAYPTTATNSENIKVGDNTHIYTAPWINLRRPGL
jgi:guanine nucleotide-binding protein subunit alpha